LEQTLQRRTDAQRVIREILNLSLQEIDLPDLLERSVNLVFSLPWLSFDRQGAVFLVEDDPDVLVLKAHRGYSPSMQALCGVVPFGHCLCGRAAKQNQMLFASHLTDEHDTHYEGIVEHGHYVVPIALRGEVLGVLNVYLKEGHVQHREEGAFLAAVADALAGIVQHAKSEADKKSYRSQLEQVQKMEALGRVAGGVAHDFNNYLTAIQGHTELSMRKVDETDPVFPSLQSIAEAAEHAADLTRQLLTFGRRGAVERTPLHLNQVIESLAQILDRFIGESIELCCELANVLPSVVANADHIEQVLVNLSVNARDAMPDGGRLRIATESVLVSDGDARLRAQARPGEFVQLSVSDSGQGMGREVLADIFHPFFTTKAQGRGTGLGLAVVYGIVQQHDGWIEVDSEPGKDSTFRIFLPMAA